MITLANAKRYLGLSDKAVSIVGNGTLATATLEGHDFKTGDVAEITGTTSYNGTHSVIRLNANQFTFSSNASTTETGLIAKYDFVLNLILAGVNNYINNYTGAKWESSATVSNQIVDCPGDGIIFTDKMPLATVSAIRISVDRDFSTADKYEDLTSSDYLIYEEEGRIELLGSKALEVFGARKSVRISYTTGTIPAAIQDAAYQLLNYQFRLWNDKAQNLTSRTNNGEQIFFEKKIPENIKELLNPYVRVVIGSGVRSPRNYYF